MKIHSQSNMLGIAAQQLELDEQQYQAGVESQQAARAAKSAENQRAVDEMHEQASSIRTGAWTEGSIEVVGGGMSVGGSLSSSSTGTQPAPATQDPSAEIAPGDAPSTEAKAPAPPTPARTERASPWSVGGQAISGMASPAGRLVGEAPAKEHEANAAGHRNIAEQTGWAMDDATQAKERADHRADQALQIMADAARETRDARASAIAKLAGA